MHRRRLQMSSIEILDSLQNGAFSRGCSCNLKMRWRFLELSLFILIAEYCQSSNLLQEDFSHHHKRMQHFLIATAYMQSYSKPKRRLELGRLSVESVVPPHGVLCISSGPLDFLRSLVPNRHPQKITSPHSHLPIDQQPKHPIRSNKIAWIREPIFILWRNVHNGGELVRIPNRHLPFLGSLSQTPAHRVSIRTFYCGAVVTFPCVALFWFPTRDLLRPCHDNKE